MPLRRYLIALGAAAAFASSLIHAASENAWPNRPVHMIVSFAAGGPADTYARCLLLDHHDRPPFSGRPSLMGHCGHGWTCSLPRPVANDAVDGAHSTGIDVPKGGYVKEQPQ